MSERTEQPTQEIAALKRQLQYDPVTGIFRWRKSGGNQYSRPGMRAGFLNEKGYRRICVAGKYYRAARIAWAFYHGEWLPNDIEPDHKNGIRDDNRIDNLRPATRLQNSRSHRSRGAAGTSFKGIRKKPDRPSWEAYLRIDGRRTFLGCFATAEAAARAYDVAAKVHYGEWATLNFPAE